MEVQLRHLGMQLRLISLQLRHLAMQQRHAGTQLRHLRQGGAPPGQQSLALLTKSNFAQAWPKNSCCR